MMSMRTFLKSLSILLVLQMCSLSASAADNCPLTQQFSGLRDAYTQLKQQHTKENEETFLRLFPETWTDYLLLGYACDHNLLDGNSDEYCTTLCRLSLVNDTLLCEKLVNLARGAVYDVDVPNYFHYGLHESGCVRCEGYGNRKDLCALMLKLVSGMSRGDQFRFWAFYWSSLDHEEDGGNHPDEHQVEYDRIAALLAKQYPRMATVCRDVWKYYSRGVMFQSQKYSSEYLLYWSEKAPANP